MVDNFQNLMELFLAVASNFMKLLSQRMGGGKERTMNNRQATTNQVKDGGKRLKQKLSQTESAIKNVLSKKLFAQRDA
jgi:hypothetical protein